MKTNVNRIFNKTLEKTHIWLRDLMEELDWEDEHKAYSALRVVLQTLRDRLTIEETAHLGAQLPMLVRGFYFEGWDPSGKPVKERHVEQLLARIAREFRRDDVLETERMARAVFALLKRRIADGEIEDVKSVLPDELKHLWP